MNERSDRIVGEELLASLPGEWPHDLLPEIAHQVEDSNRKVVVLDDDPTGTQTVHGIPVLTEWSVESLCDELLSEPKSFYILTNSRSLPLHEAIALNAEIGHNLLEASRLTGKNFVIVSRSDSTLRGHYPGEVEALAQALGQGFDAWLIIPFFLEGGRYTIDDVHYVAKESRLVPAGETEFARDTVFGYSASNLKAWVEEKTKGRVSANSVASVSIGDLRQAGPTAVADRLIHLSQGQICVVNSASYRDQEVFVQGLLEAEEQGHRFLYRTAASFVRVRAGISPRPLLTKVDLNLKTASGGLLVVGSHVPRTSSQVSALLAETDTVGIEIDVQVLLDEDKSPSEIASTAEMVDNALKNGRDVVVYTSRRLITGTDSASNLSIGQRVSAGLVSMIRSISTRPRYVLTKGGITSSDVATRGFGVRRAMVMGQILPGVPVWKLGAESLHPGLSYIVFPGNVGDSKSLVKIVEILRSQS